MTPEEILELLKSNGITSQIPQAPHTHSEHNHECHFEKTHECHIPHFYHVNHLADKFHVVTVVSNPVMYKSRYRLFKKFEKHMRASGVQHLHVIEIQNGNRAFQVTQEGNPYHTQLRTQDEIWVKENGLNLAIQRLARSFPDWKYVAWIDADIEFTRPDWVEKTINELQVNKFVQLFQTAVDLGPKGHAMHTHNGFVYSWWNKLSFKSTYDHWHPGFAWAATREAISNVGMLIDRAILGSADRHMCMSMIGKGCDSYNPGVSQDYKDMVSQWEELAKIYINRKIGFIDGTILHHWHGKKKDRGYKDRWKILVEHQYSPFKDVTYDWQGVLQLNPTKVELRDDIRKYFFHRNEDSIDLE